MLEGGRWTFVPPFGNWELEAPARIARWTRRGTSLQHQAVIVDRHAPVVGGRLEREALELEFPAEVHAPRVKLLELRAEPVQFSLRIAHLGLALGEQVAGGANVI